MEGKVEPPFLAAVFPGGPLARAEVIEGGALPLLAPLLAEDAVGAMKEEVLDLGNDDLALFSLSLEAWKEVEELNPPEALDFLLIGPLALGLLFSYGP